MAICLIFVKGRGVQNVILTLFQCLRCFLIKKNLMTDCILTQMFILSLRNSVSSLIQEATSSSNPNVFLDCLVKKQVYCSTLSFFQLLFPRQLCQNFQNIIVTENSDIFLGSETFQEILPKEFPSKLLTFFFIISVGSVTFRRVCYL